jgi:SAM-dependent methyltransferase
MKEIIDNFSDQPASYAAFRPTPPSQLYDFLFSKVKTHGIAWDCGTGNGQIAVKLADKFKLVYATDISQKQLDIAPKRTNIIYNAERAEQSSIPDNCIDLITVAQAVHWFDFDAFNKEVKRVAKPDSVIAILTYYLLRVNNEIDALVDELYWDITRKYWDKERQYVDDQYQTIPFPYKEMPTPEFSIVLKWNINQMLGYLRTWSGVKHFKDINKKDPISLIEPELRSAWRKDEMMTVRFPLFIRVGEIVK